ncbi:T9SS type A sorting domain-containing protein [Saccharicrinis aurantiacus]|uniref:T9SS type A sorting domain-containing protein n=1 Tax=Saccharicrinis aurantiacus TaxID=1849719 RepID=UPI00249240AB|nr:T9SS type A sorting domain-containing protein [Saccharicrinis aurantiacus]
MKKNYFKMMCVIVVLAITSFTSVSAQYMTLYENDFSQETTGTYHLGTELTPNPWTGLNFTNAFWKKENDNGLNFGNWRGVNLSSDPLINWLESKRVKVTFGLYLNVDGSDKARAGLIVTPDGSNVVPKVGFEILSYSAAGGLEIKVGGTTFTTAGIPNGTSITIEQEITKSSTSGEFSTVTVITDGTTEYLNETIVCTDADLYDTAFNGNNTLFNCYNQTTNNMAFWSSFKLERDIPLGFFANGGASQTVTPNTTVTLNASSTFDGVAVNDATYLWEAPNGITLSDVTAVSPTFDTPTTGRITEYLFKVTATNVGGSSETSVSYTKVLINPDDIFGSSTEPYEISTADHLFNLSLTGETYLGSDFVLTGDIDLTNEDYFTPIGDYTGTFDGQNHIITGLKIMEESGHVGLFTRIKWGSLVKNIGLVNPNILNTGDGNTGGIVGYLDADLVENCFVMGGEITGSKRVGGIAGTCANWSGEIRTIVKNCFTYTNVMGAEPGGLIGASNGGSGNMILEDCAVYGNVMYEGTTDMGPASIDGTPTDIVLSDIYFKGGIATSSAIAGETELLSTDLADIASYPGLETTIWGISPKFGFAVLSVFDVESLDIALDIENDIKEVSLNVYPNPVVDVLNITDVADGSIITVYSATGSIVSVIRAAGGLTQVDLSSQPTGVYLVKVADKVTRVLKK